MIDQGAELSVTRQCELLGLNRTGVYCALSSALFRRVEVPLTLE
jgi:hypothetical protein